MNIFTTEIEDSKRMVVKPLRLNLLGNFTKNVLINLLCIYCRGNDASDKYK